MFDAITDEVRARLSDGRRRLQARFVSTSTSGRPRWSLDRTVLSVLLVAGSVLLGFTWWRSSRAPEVEMITADAATPTPAPTAPEPTPGDQSAGEVSGTVRVHVVGAVAAPGVYDLDSGARGADALDAAGGATAEADLARINLAAVLTDGSQLFVPLFGQAPPPGPASENDPAGDTVNINTATLEELDTLPGVGEATAEKIIAHRDEHGPFDSVDALVDVSGIGEQKLADLRDRVTV